MIDTLINKLYSKTEYATLVLVGLNLSILALDLWVFILCAFKVNIGLSLSLWASYLLIKINFFPSKAVELSDEEMAKQRFKKYLPTLLMIPAFLFLRAFGI